jgi:hypothetical protein
MGYEVKCMGKTSAKACHGRGRILEMTNCQTRMLVVTLDRLDDATELCRHINEEI